MRDVAESIFRESARLKLAFLEAHLDLVVRAAEAIVGALRAGRKVLLFGNGGSAADAQHLAQIIDEEVQVVRRLGVAARGEIAHHISGLG